MLRFLFAVCILACCEAQAGTCGSLSSECTAALQDSKNAAKTIKLVLCLNSTRLCNLIGGPGLEWELDCNMSPAQYTFARAPDRCSAAERATQACLGQIHVCDASLQKVFDGFQCEVSPPLVFAISLSSLVILAAIGVCAIRISARVARIRSTSDSSCLQQVDLAVRKWQNLIWRILKLKSRRPCGMITEQLLPLLLSVFLIVIVNLDPATLLNPRWTLWTQLGFVTVDINFGRVQPSQTTQDIMQQLTVLLPLFFTLCYAKFVSSLTGELVRDKESRASELLKIMGTPSASLQLSWFCCQMVLGLPLAIALSVSLTSGNVFPSADIGSLIMFFYVFYLTIVAYAQAAAPFFTTSRAASWVSVLIWVLLHVIAYQARNSSLSQAHSWALLPQVAFFLGINRLSAQAVLPALPECQDTLANYMGVDTCTGYMCLNTVIFLFIAWYCDKVVPQQFGAPLRWTFCCRPSYWRPNRRRQGYSEMNMQDDMQQLSRAFVEDDATLHDGVVIQGLCKEFKLKKGEIKQAVIDLRLSLPRDSVTALLGHNGAGKTTTIDMLTGLLIPTLGTAQVLGLDLREDMDAIRSKMGVCLQYDVLFGRLSVLDHVLFFAVAKGTVPELALEKAKEMVKEVGLAEKMNARAESLSGGQKRKLSLAIALVGDSQVVFLDEPTSGMDPHSRRCTWDVIRRHRAGRVIILTTHFMDEADILGDMIAVMSDGVLQCAGSSLFLKNKYGCGYSLSLVASRTEQDRILDFVQRFVPEAKSQTAVGSELALQLPTHASASFPNLLRALDVEKKALGIEEYGVSLTTLEDVFLKIASENNHFSINHATAKPTVTAEGSSCTRQFGALLKKRWQYGKRDWQVAGLGLVLPLLFLTALLLMPAVDITSLNLLPGYRKASAAQLQNPLFLQCVAARRCSPDDTAHEDFSQCFGITSTCSCSLDRLQDCSCTNGCSVNSVRNEPCQDPFCPDGGDDCYNQQCMRKRDYKWQATLNVFLAALTVTLALTFVSVAMIVYVVREQEPQQNARLQQLISGAHPLAYWLSLSCFDLATAIIPAFAAAASLSFFLQSQAGLLHTAEQTLALVALAVMYTVAHIPITYAFSFRFNQHSKAQTGILVFGLLTGPLLAICAEVVKVIHYQPIMNYSLSRMSGAYGIWFYLLFPGFALCDGLYQINLYRMGVPLGYFGDGVGRSPARASTVLVFPYCFDPPRADGYIADDFDTSCWASMGTSCCTPSIMAWQVVGRNFVYLFVEGIAACLLLWFLDARQRRGKDSALCRWRCGSAKVVPEDYSEDSDVEAERRRINAGDISKDTIVIQNLSKTYPTGKVALESLCLGVGNECFGYLGVNGAGKTTTMKILTGCIQPSGGSATLGGFDAINDQLQARTIMGYCPQFDALLDFLTVREHLVLFSHLKGLPIPQVEHEVELFLERMNLTVHQHKLTNTLSAGNKRKLSAALALLGRPRVIFLDEPSSGMDPAARRFMWEVIREVADGGCSVLLTTHSMEECEALCAKIGVLVAGRLMCLGSAQHLKAKFGTGFRVEGRLKKKDTSDVLARLPGTAVTADQVPVFCQALGIPEWTTKVVDTHPSGWLLAHQIANRGLSAEAFAEWWVLEEVFEDVVKYLGARFGAIEVRERHGVHFALSVKAASVASVFEEMHRLQEDSVLDDYSVSQTTLEEIFNNFAGEGED